MLAILNCITCRSKWSEVVPPTDQLVNDKMLADISDVVLIYMVADVLSFFACPTCRLYDVDNLIV
jgi:hypothetical protein